MTPQLGLILGGMAILLIGWVIGFLDSNNRTAKKIQAAEVNAGIAIKEAEKKIAHANQKIAQIPDPQLITSQDDPGLLRLKNNHGNFTLEIDGAPINSALSPDGKKRLIELLTVIRPYLEGGFPTQSVPTPQAVHAAPAPIIKPAVVVPAQTAATADADLQKPVVKIEDKKAMASLSMVAQIDSVLQVRLLNTSLSKRGIRLIESSQGGVEVEVGLEKFETIDDVTDQEVKAAIRAAITEWEKKFTPGL